MTRENLFSGPWDGDDDETGTRQRVFWRPDGARMGATLYELPPARREPHAHAFRRRGDVLRAPRPSAVSKPGRRGALAPGDVVFCPEGRAGLHTFSNPTDEPVELLAISAGSFPDVVAYPEDGYAWVATRDPEPDQLAKGGDPGIIARFEIPIE